MGFKKKQRNFSYKVSLKIAKLIRMKDLYGNTDYLLRTINNLCVLQNKNIKIIQM